MKIYEIITEAASDGTEPVRKNSTPTDQQLAVFIGPNAKNYDFDMQRSFLRMEKGGAHRNDIWDATGTFRNANGDIRQEISDKDMEFKVDPGTIAAGTSYKAFNIIHHPEFFANYPKFKNATITFVDPADSEGSAGLWDQSSNTLFITKKPTVAGQEYAEWEDYLDTAVHELDHVAQSNEKPNNHLYNNPGDHTSQFNQSDWEQYAADSRETYSRLAAARREMDAKQRALSTPTPTDQPYISTQARSAGINYNYGPFTSATTYGDPKSNQNKHNPQVTSDNPYFYDKDADPMQDPTNQNLAGEILQNRPDNGVLGPLPDNWSIDNPKTHFPSTGEKKPPAKKPAAKKPAAKKPVDNGPTMAQGGVSV